MRARAPFSIQGSLNLSVVQELEALLDLAKRGELVSLAYIANDSRERTYTGRAGLCQRDTIRAGGTLLKAAIRCINDDESPP